MVDNRYNVIKERWYLRMSCNNYILLSIFTGTAHLILPRRRKRIGLLFVYISLPPSYHYITHHITPLLTNPFIMYPTTPPPLLYYLPSY